MTMIHSLGVVLAVLLSGSGTWALCSLTPERRCGPSCTNAGALCSADGSCAGCTAGCSDLIFNSCNIVIRNGAGATASVNGRGNLVVGYNESFFGAPKTGSHNLVVGRFHSYTNYAGVVAGEANAIQAEGAITGGILNVAQGPFSSITGGAVNSTATTAQYASVAGGSQNTATGVSSAVVGGEGNICDGAHSVLVGGELNVVQNVHEHSVHLGGMETETTGDASNDWQTCSGTLVDTCDLL